ncbi:Hypothetical protein CINCED_3A003808 [Cinara cedri]|uniref:Uncharacterized protein n=1 Tax=Cinara cedri TaxID=506608 RepID=A0A5E4MBX2_9HEMI|nr:Hypothetical protein CINCED_3A003808 [Cinara cedri]
MAASDYKKSTVQQIKDAPLEELRKDARVWMAYERGWCDFMQAYVGAQLMQSNAEVELCDYVNYHTRRTRQLAAAGNGTDADEMERERDRRQRAGRPVATVSAARRRCVDKTGAAVEPEDDRAAEQERGRRRRAHSPDDDDRDAAVSAVQESMGRITLADWPASGTSDEDGRFRSV